MALTKCPSCQNKISSKAENCSHCGFSLADNNEEIDQLNKQKYRQYRTRMYQLKMLSFVAMALTLVGVIPMIWDYIKSIDYGFNVSVLNHWGINLVFVGFVMYVLVRIAMLKVKRNYKSNKIKS